MRNGLGENLAVSIIAMTVALLPAIAFGIAELFGWANR